MLDGTRIACALDYASKEHQRAVEENGRVFKTRHDGFGVLLEEYDELSDEYYALKKQIFQLRQALRNDNDSLKSCLKDMASTATYLLCEAAQVAAMIKKFQESIEAGYKE